MIPEYSIELRFEGNDLDQDNLTSEMGLTPSHLRITKDGLHLWAYNGSDKFDEPIYWHSFEEGFSFLLDKLEGLEDIIKKYRDQYSAYFWCGHFFSDYNGKLTFSPLLLERIAKLKIEIILHSYYSKSDEE